MVEKPVGRRGRPRGGEEARSHLEFHGGTYRVTILVPERVRHIVGAARLRHDLQTGNLQIAALAKLPHIARFRERIDEALASLGETDRERDLAAYREIVADWRLHPDRYKEGQIAAIERDLGIPVGERVGHVERAPPIPSNETPLVAAHDRFLSEHGVNLSPRTLANDRLAFEWLLRWLAGERVPASMEAMTALRVQQFAEVLPDLAGIALTTKGRFISRMSAFWAWAVQVQIVPENTWLGTARSSRWEVLTVRKFNS